MPIVRFGPYSLDLETCDLKLAGAPVHLRRQPAQILAVLVRRAGDLVSRQEIIDAVWPGTTVEFDQGLNSCIRQLRRALEDDADAPVWIETIPRRGYRFLGTVDPVAGVSGGDRTAPARHHLRRALWMGVPVVAMAAGVLLRSAWGNAEHEPVRLVVLPLASNAADTALTAAGDLLLNDLIDHLARLDPSTLGVIARASARHYRSTSVDARTIGRELDVGYLLEGTLTREGTDVRLGLRLIRADRQTQLWATGMTAPLDSLLDSGGALAGAAAAAVLPRLALRRRAEPSEPPPDQRGRFLEARYLLDRGTAPAVAGAAERFRVVLAAAPAFAPAAAGLAQALFRQGQWGGAQRAARQALAHDPENVRAHAMLADIALLRDWDWAAAEAGYRRALEIAPGDAEAHNGYGFMLATMGRSPEELSHVELAQRLDPVSPVVNSDLGYMYFWAGRPERAVVSCRRAVELAGSRAAFEACLMAAFATLGRGDSSLAHARRLVRGRAGGGADSADIPTLDAYWERVLRDEDGTGSGAAYRRGLAYAALGRPDAAVASLAAGVRAHRAARAGDQHDMGLYVVLGIDPRFDPLRHHPGFAAVMDSVGVPQMARR